MVAATVAGYACGSTAAKKLYTGIVQTVHDVAPTQYTARPLESVLGQNAMLQPATLNFWTWMAAYYVCYPGDVMLAALPALFRIGSETRLLLHPDYITDSQETSDDEFLILEALEVNGELMVADVQRIVTVKM